MNYRKIYDDLILSRVLMDRMKIKHVHHIHHIIPRSLGGTNCQDNLVVLTYREHFISHWLLWKIHGNGTQGTAFGLMCKNNMEHNAKNSKKYIIAMKALSKSTSLRMTGMTKENSDVRRRMARSFSLSTRNKTIYDFYHIKHGRFIGNVQELIDKFSSQNLNSSNIWELCRSKINVIHGWVLYENKNDIDQLLHNSKFPTLGKVIANNGIISKFFVTYDDIPIGWEKGRIRTNVPRTFVTNGIINKKIKKNELDDFLNINVNWINLQLHKKSSKTSYINNNISNVLMLLHKIPEYLINNKDWKIGKIKTRICKSGISRMYTNNIINKMVLNTKAKQFLIDNKDWRLGKTFKN